MFIDSKCTDKISHEALIPHVVHIIFDARKWQLWKKVEALQAGLEDFFWIRTLSNV